MTTIEPISVRPLTIVLNNLTYCQHTPTMLRAAGVPEANIVAAVQAALKAEIDDVAEALRLKVVTPGAGQAMEYQETQTQAEAAIASPAGATAALYPMLAATIGVDVDPESHAPATDILGVARSVLAARAAWTVIGSEIRAARLKGKAAVDAATDVAGASAAFDAIIWPAVG